MPKTVIPQTNSHTGKTKTKVKTQPKAGKIIIGIEHTSQSQKKP